MIIYLHGFRSGPQSQKATSLAARMAERGMRDQFWGEQLAYEPIAAIAQADAAIAASPTPCLVVGSSLGGFYASVLAYRLGLPAVLVNPFVPHEGFDPQQFIGEQEQLYTGERFTFTQAHSDQIVAMNPAQITQPEKLWLLAEAADEVLDTRIAEARYVGARQTILPGGDHSFTCWLDYLDEIIDLHAQLSAN